MILAGERAGIGLFSGLGIMSVLTSHEGRVFRITINRPEKRNALNLALCHVLLAATARSNPGRFGRR